MSSSPAPHILLIAPEPFFEERGTPMNVRAMVEGLSELGYLVDLLVYPIGTSLQIPQVTIHRSSGVPGISSVPIGPSWKKIVLDVFLSLKAIRLVLFGRKYAAIHGVEEAGVIAALLAPLRRIPFIVDMDSCMRQQLEESGFCKRRWLLAFVSMLEVFALRRANAVLTVCQALSKKAQRIAPNTPLFQIEDFPLESATEIDERVVEQFMDAYNLHGKQVLLYTGNLESYQGIDLLLEGFQHCLSTQESAQREQICLVLVGGSEQKKEHYKERAKELGICKQTILAGARPSAEMGSLMSLSHALLSPRTEGENTPLKIYTYMAAGKPIVATKIFSHTQVLSEKNAFLAEPMKRAFGEALVQAVDMSPAGQSRQRAVVKEAKKLIETKYNRQEFVRRLDVLYSHVLGD